MHYQGTKQGNKTEKTQLIIHIKARNSIEKTELTKLN